MVRITEASDQADVLAARLATLSSELAQMGEQVERVEGMRGGMERAENIAVEVANRLERIEAQKADIDEAMRDLTSLRGAREEVRESLEQLRGPVPILSGCRSATRKPARGSLRFRIRFARSALRSPRWTI